mgnify:CR=1 FL=1
MSRPSEQKRQRRMHRKHKVYRAGINKLRERYVTTVVAESKKEALQ